MYVPRASAGTALGGGTFLGLARLLTRFHEFQQALDAAHDGDARHTDMLVRDIYGSGDERACLKLPGDLTASFFAKSLLANTAALRAHPPRILVCPFRSSFPTHKFF